MLRLSNQSITTLEWRGNGMNRLRALLATSLLVTLLSSVSPISASSEDVSTVPAGAPPTNAELDALLEARDWGRLSSALLSPPSDAVKRYLDWLQVKLAGGAGFLVAYSYMRYLWIAGNASKVDDPGRDLRVTAGMIALYAYELIVIDGAKCEDKSAPDNRMSQLLSLNPATLSFLKSRPAELKEKVVALALALEKRTAMLRRDDDLLCRNGLDEMKAGLERGTQREVPNTSGYYGRRVLVAPPPDWVPKFVPPQTYVPIQNTARAEMREALRELIQ
jgi:hypothetical protein